MTTDLHDQISAWVEGLDLGPPVTPDEARARAAAARGDRRPRRSRHRVLVAAAVLVLLVVGAMVVRSGPDDAVTTGPSTTEPIPRDLDELADRVAVMPTTVLGETDDARYTYRRGVRVLQSDPDGEPSTRVEQQWVALDGRGRYVVEVEGAGRDLDETRDEPGSYQIGFLPPRTAIDLPDDPDVVLAAIERGTGSISSLALVDLLTYTGLPGPARAGVLRALGRIGFVPVSGADLGPNLWRLEGPSTDGLTMRVDLDLRTGEAVAWEREALSMESPGGDPAPGAIDRWRASAVDLRPDTQDP